jgi:hypothetical protein
VSDLRPGTGKLSNLRYLLHSQSEPILPAVLISIQFDNCLRVCEGLDEVTYYSIALEDPLEEDDYGQR